MNRSYMNNHDSHKVKGLKKFLQNIYPESATPGTSVIPSADEVDKIVELYQLFGQVVQPN